MLIFFSRIRLFLSRPRTKNHLVTADSVLFGASTIRGKKSSLVYRYVPKGAARLEIVDGVARITTRPAHAGIYYPPPKNLSFVSICGLGLNTIYQLARSVIAWLHQRSAYQHAIILVLFFLTVAASYFGVNKVQLQVQPASIINGTAYEKPRAGNAAPNVQATRATEQAQIAATPLATSILATVTAQAPTLVQTPIQTSPNLPGAPGGVLYRDPTPTQPRFPTPLTTAINLALPRFPTSTTTQTPPGLTKKQQVEAAIDVDLSDAQPSKLDVADAKKPAFQDKPVSGFVSVQTNDKSPKQTSPYKAVTTNDGKLVIQTTNGTFVEVRTGQTLPGGETLTSVEPSGNGYTTSAGQKILINPKE